MMKDGDMASELMYGNGCKHYHDCFTCPFDSECIDGMIVESKRAIYGMMREQAQELFKQGKSIQEVLAVVPIGQRTAYRYKNLPLVSA